VAGDLSYGGAVQMIVCLAVTDDGFVDPRWGRADRVAVADVGANGIESWHEFDVGWDHLHDSGPEGGHHARIARFLREHNVEAVVANHMGPPMGHMLGKMGIEVRLGTAGRAREAALGVLGGRPHPETDAGD
jgi:predicted Fe-Mo cluster-binding NifX family protein